MVLVFGAARTDLGGSDDARVSIGNVEGEPSPDVLSPRLFAAPQLLDGED